MKKSIKKRIITRILNEPIKASNLLDHLSSVLYADREFYESLSNTQLKKNLKQHFLILLEKILNL
mgnify:CR=1 FL=1